MLLQCLQKYKNRILIKKAIYFRFQKPLDRVLSNMIYDYVASSTTYAIRQNRGRNLENRDIVAAKKQKKRGEFSA